MSEKNETLASDPTEPKPEELTPEEMEQISGGLGKTILVDHGPGWIEP